MQLAVLTGPCALQLDIRLTRCRPTLYRWRAATESRSRRRCDWGGDLRALPWYVGQQPKGLSDMTIFGHRDAGSVGGLVSPSIPGFRIRFVLKYQEPLRGIAYAW